MRTFLVTALILGAWAGAGVLPAAGAEKEEKKADQRVYELRTYHVPPGKMDALNARFRDHTCKLLEKHGMKLVGFWVSTEPKEAAGKLIYVVAHESREAAAKSWEAFRKDPAWIAAKEASEKDGKLTEKVESVFMKPTDYSALK